MANDNMLNKIKNLALYSVDNLLEKAKKQGQVYNVPRKTVYVDETVITDQGGYQEKATIIPFDVLRQMAEKSMPVIAILNKFCNRVSAFSRPQRNRFDLGYVIKLRDHSKTITDEDKKEVEIIERYINYTGHVTDGRPRSEIRNFDTFLRLIVRDSLIYNQLAIECVPSKDGTMSYFVPVPAGTIRFAVKNIGEKYTGMNSLVLNVENDPDKAKRINETDLNDVRYLQVYRGQIFAAYTEDELIYKQRLPSKEIVYQGYAPGELEFVINAVANHRIAEIHNEVFFKQGHSNNGILNIKADLTEEQLQGIRRMLQRQSAGVRNAHRQIVFANTAGIEWLPMSSMTNKDMEWNEWMMYLIKIICAVYGLNPSEINFDISRDASSALGDGGKRNEVMLRDTRNSMLRPLLNFVQDIINDEIMPRFNKEYALKYCFEFVGLDASDEDTELDRVKKKVTSVYTVNEARKELQMKPIADGDIILDSVFIQYAINKMQMQQQPAPSGGDEMNSEASVGESDLVEPTEADVDETEGAAAVGDEEGIDELLAGIMDPNADEANKALQKIGKKLTKAKKKPIKIEWVK